MPQKTIYVKDEHLKLWDEVKELIGDESLSEVVVEGLQRVIDARKAVQGDFERIQLEVGNRGYSHIIAFHGRHIADYDVADDHRIDQGHPHVHDAYLTHKGNILIYTENGNECEGHSEGNTYYKWFNTLVEADKEKDCCGNRQYPPELINEIAEALGENYVEELDI